MTPKTFTLSLALAAFALSPFASALLPSGLNGAAFAEKGGNGGGSGKDGGNGHSKTEGWGKVKTGNGADEKSVSHGALASELKGLNAVKASPNALLHANPNSQVGRIATYYQAAVLTKDARTKLTDANAALVFATANQQSANNALGAALDSGTATEAEIYALTQAVAAAQRATESARVNYNTAYAVVQRTEVGENNALLLASGGRVLSDEAVAYVRSQLGL